MVDLDADDTQDWGDSDIIPIRDDLAGESDGDNIRHMIMRQAFLSEFWQDEGVQAQVSDFANTIGLDKPAQRLANAGDRLAELVGLTIRGELGNLREVAFEEIEEENRAIAS